MPKIKSITAREILDSRGNPTIEATVITSSAKGVASVPSGASRGVHEAVELRDGKLRFGGLGVKKAIKSVAKISLKLKGKHCTQQREIDTIMINLDGTKNKKKLGANAILAVSLACARAGAQVKKQELWQYLGELTTIKNLNRKFQLPRAYCNVINGGRHADNNLSFQEFMIVPSGKKFAKNLQIASDIYHELKKVIYQKFGAASTGVGDEGGFAPNLKSAEEALKLLVLAIKNAGFAGMCDIAIDAAASEFYNNKKKVVDEKRYQVDGKKLSTDELLKYYIMLIKKYPIVSIEDPFAQEDFKAFAKLTKLTSLDSKQKVQIVADDLTVTNVERIKIAAKSDSANCLLLKLNQIGTLSEALDAAGLAYFNHWNVMVSHRSGETLDTFISDLAVALGCGQIKAGAPCRGERVAKYNRLLEIESCLK